MDGPVPAPNPFGAVHHARLVRPYTLTAGRTGTNVDLPLEAPVQTLPAGPVYRGGARRCARQDHPAVRPELI